LSTRPATPAIVEYQNEVSAKLQFSNTKEIIENSREFPQVYQPEELTQMASQFSAAPMAPQFSAAPMAPMAPQVVSRPKTP
jgi:hypothetical protein